MDAKIIREEMNRLDKISGLDTSNIPVRISTRMTKGWGRCVYQRDGKKYSIKELIFSQRLLEYGTLEHILNVIRHEYAHAYVALVHNRIHHHDIVWKRAALRFGCNTRRTENFDEVTERDTSIRYKVICAHCGAISAYYRETKIVKELKARPDSQQFYCKQCRNHKFILETVSKS